MTTLDDYNTQLEYIKKNTINPPTNDDDACSAMENIRFAINYALRLDPERVMEVMKAIRKWTVAVAKAKRPRYISFAGNYLPDQIDFMRYSRECTPDTVKYTYWCAAIFVVVGNAGAGLMNNDQGIKNRAIAGAKQFDLMAGIFDLTGWVNEILRA